MHDTLRALVENGGNVEIGLEVPADLIKTLLSMANRTGAQITIRASAYPVETLLDLAREGRGNLTVRFD